MSTRRQLSPVWPAPARRRSLAGDVVPQPGRCGEPRSEASGRASPRCNAELSSAPTVLFPAEHPVLAAQRAVNEILDDGVADFGVYADEPCFAWTALPDIRAIAAHILAYTTPDDLTNVLPADLVNAYRAAAKRPATPWHPNPQSKPGLQAPAHAAAAAASVTAAMDILSCSDVTAAGMAMRWLITAVRDHGLTITPTTVVSWGKNTSQTLASTQFKAIAPIMNCSSQLRYRTGAAAPRRPDRCRSTTRRIAAALPSTLWPAWWCRLGVGGRNPGLQRLALPCAVLIVGTRLDWSDAARYLGSVIGAHSAGQEIARFATGPHWPALQVALIGLSDYLADHRTAINYRRRRCLDYTGLLPDGQWGQICRHVESDAAGCVPAGLARLVLFEKITAMPARCAPFASGPRPSQATIDNAALLLTPGQMDGMNGAASEFLNSHKIREPVTWHPPLRLLNGLDLPGRDPRSINRDVLLALAAPRDLFAHQLAHRLGTDAATVRHLLDAHPAPTLSYAARVRRRSAPVMDATRSTLTPEQFVELYVNQALSLKEIAHRLGVSRKRSPGSRKRKASDCGHQVRRRASAASTPPGFMSST